MFDILVFGICSGAMCAGCAMTRHTPKQHLIYTFMGGFIGGLINKYMYIFTGVYFIATCCGATVNGVIISHINRNDKFTYIFIAASSTYCLGRGIWPVRIFMYGFLTNLPMVLQSLNNILQITGGTVLGLYLGHILYKKAKKRSRI